MKKISLCCLVIITAPTFIHTMQLSAKKTDAERTVDANVEQLLLTKECKGCFLAGAFLKGKDLREAQLQGANLSEANLSEADLSYAHLENANLSYANAKLANFYQTKLSGATLNKVHAPPITNPWPRYIFQTPLDFLLHTKKSTV